jgi:5'-nucleotidase / UDP-sugar diphosphatase
MPLLLAPLLMAGACTSTSTDTDTDNGATTASETDRKIISILHTNDMHGSYMPFHAVTDNATAQTGDEGRELLLNFSKEAEIGGFAYLASAIKKVRQKKGVDKVILLDGGDTFSDDQLSNLTKGEVMIRLMNTVDYDMMALGNHDFDYGLDRTRELEELSNFPMRAANIEDNQTKQPIFGDPYIVLEKNGINVAILALGYRNTPKTGNPDNVKDLRFSLGQEAVQKYLPEMREKADIIVVLSHEGTAVDYKMAQEVEGIDVIIGAHSHDIIEPRKKFGNTYVVQAMSDAAVLGDTELIIEGNKLVDVKDNYHYLWHDEWEADQEAQAIINEMRQPHKGKLEEVVVQSKDVIGRQYKSESPFDRLVGNLMNEGYNGDVAIMPGVGYGISFTPGPITSERVYKLLPHPSRIVTLNMTGAQLRATMEQTATNLKPDDPMAVVGGLIQTAGIQYDLDFNKPVGQRVSNVRIGNQAINDARSYKVVTHNGLLTGLHNYTEIAKGQNINRTEKSLTEFIIEMLKKRKEVGMPENMGEVKITRK